MFTLRFRLCTYIFVQSQICDNRAREAGFLSSAIAIQILSNLSSSCASSGIGVVDRDIRGWKRHLFNFH